MDVQDARWPPVDRLPNEVLLTIFTNLSRPADHYSCMLVCRRWAKNVVETLWHRPACTDWQKYTKICRTLVREEPFFGYRDFLRRLNLTNLAERLNDGSIQPFSFCTRIERLTLPNCHLLTDSGLVLLVEGSSSLLAVDISKDVNITEKSINAMAANCKRLQGLNISGCENISNESLINLAQNCRYIKRIKLNECVQIRDEAVKAFAQYCPNILEIDLQQCNQIGNASVIDLLVKGNCLRELRLPNCELIDNDAFLSIPSDKTFEHLRILDLTSCTRLTDAAVQKIIDVAPRLRNLVLSKCRNITDISINAISRLGKNLHYVHLGHCGQITDEGVKRLVHNCNRIRYIDLGCCTNLTDESIKRLAQLPKLKRIGLVKCSSITDDSVNALAEAGLRRRFRRDGNVGSGNTDLPTSSLERVHLSYCTNLTLKSIMGLLNAYPRLTHLSLTGVAAFQRDDFQPFCRQAPTEFTQHQRDVFCVFSGNMVSEFRNFLNNEPRFAEFRDTYPGAAIRSVRQVVYNPAVIRPDDEADDDEMIGEEEAFDASDMPPNTHMGNANPPTNDHLYEHQMPATFVPPPSTIMNSHNGHTNHPPHILHTDDTSSPLAFSSFLTNAAASGHPPLSARGQSLATLAALRSSGGSSTPNGASTASMHRQPHSPSPHHNGDGSSAQHE